MLVFEQIKQVAIWKQIRHRVAAQLRMVSNAGNVVLPKRLSYLSLLSGGDKRPKSKAVKDFGAKTPAEKLPAY
jgi:hypothetical protein